MGVLMIEIGQWAVRIGFLAFVVLATPCVVYAYFVEMTTSRGTVGALTEPTKQIEGY